MKISGYVVAGDTKQPVPFATVLPVDPATNKPIVGKGTVADANGEYELNIEPNQKVHVSSIGYMTQIVPNNKADMITLKPTATTLQTAVIRPQEEGKRGGTGFASGIKIKDKAPAPPQRTAARPGAPRQTAARVADAPQQKSKMPLILGIAGAILVVAIIANYAMGTKSVTKK